MTRSQQTTPCQWDCVRNTGTNMDLTLGPLASLVVRGKFCLLMNKKVFTWFIFKFGLMLLGQPQE